MIARPILKIMIRKSRAVSFWEHRTNTEGTGEIAALPQSEG
jgi:hypothetical protein